MQQAIPYRSWTIQSTKHLNFPSPNKSTMSVTEKASSIRNSVVDTISENAAIVFARKGCCMSHVVKLLLLGLGANPAVYEVDEEDEAGVVKELEMISGESEIGKVQFPAVFIGGKLFGGLDRVMATHISGDLVPILKHAGALWL